MLAQRCENIPGRSSHHGGHRTRDRICAQLGRTHACDSVRRSGRRHRIAPPRPRDARAGAPMKQSDRIGPAISTPKAPRGHFPWIATAAAARVVCHGPRRLVFAGSACPCGFAYCYLPLLPPTPISSLVARSAAHHRLALAANRTTTDGRDRHYTIRICEGSSGSLRPAGKRSEQAQSRRKCASSLLTASCFHFALF